MTTDETSLLLALCISLFFILCRIDHRVSAAWRPGPPVNLGRRTVFQVNDDSLIPAEELPSV